MAPQRLEKIESAPGNGMASEASNPPDLVHRRAADRAQEGQSWCETAKPSAPGKALKTHKCGGNLGPVRIPRRRIVAALAERGGRRAPHFPSADQTGLTRSATASTALAQPRGDREETFPPCNPLKNHKTGTESRSRTGPASYPFVPRSRRSPASPPAPLPAGPPAPPSPRRSRSACQAAPGKPCTVAHSANPVGFGERVAARRHCRRKSSVG
jgi:hypothetical protein